MLAVGQKPPSVSCYTTISKMWSLASSKGQSASKMEVMLLNNLITEAACSHLCHILLIRSKSQVLPALKGGYLYEDMNTRRRDHCGHRRV